MKLLKGTIFSFINNPFLVSVNDSVNLIEFGGVLIDGQFIKKVGKFSILQSQYPQAEIYDYGENLITSGFIDCHMHYPQTGIIASYGKRLLDWLNEYTFPEEKKFNDINYARNIASLTLDLCIKNGTTTLASFCTTSINSVDAFFDQAQKRNMCVIAGKTCMDRNAPEYLTDSPNSAYDESKRLIKKWHNKNRAYYAITPRFAPTSTPEQLDCLGSLWSEHPDCLMQTHLSEQKEEIDWVRKLFPKSKNYLDVYDKFNLVKKNSIFGHCIHLKEAEIEMLKERKSSIAHCPTSNTFIGSGIFKMKELTSKKINVGLATDTGGGTSFSMLKTISETYKISQLNNFSLHPAQLFWLSTVGSAKALNLENKIGNVSRGQFADLNIIDFFSTHEIEQRAKRAKNFWQKIFPTLIMGDDRAIKSTWVSGKEVRFQ